MTLTITPTDNILQVVRGEQTFPAMIWKGHDERGNAVRVGVLFFDIALDGELTRVNRNKNFKEIIVLTPLT
jgi:hypothetical protein